MSVMEVAKHTPGPWTVWKKNTSDYLILGPHDGNGSPEVANVNGFIEFSDDQNKANAKLIALAPDMYEIIKELYEYSMSTGHKGLIFPKLDAVMTKINS